MSVSFYIILPDGSIAEDNFKTVIDGEEFTENRLEVNMHNAGAYDVMHALGVADFAGSRGGEIARLGAFEHQCLITLSLLTANPELDRGREGSVTGGPGTDRCMVIECARSDDYLTRNVARLRRLAEEALLRQGRLVYG